MPVIHTWSGAVNDSGAWVRAKLEPGASSAHLHVSTSPNFGTFTAFGPVSPTDDNIVSVGPAGLSPRTQYYFRWSIDGEPDNNFTGRFVTSPVPGQPASFRFAAAGDAGLTPEYPGVAGTLLPDRASNSITFDKIREHNPEFFIHLGDIHYYNPGQIVGATVGDMRRCIDDVLLQPRQHDLYRNVPLVWSYDDHDYGPNDSNKNSPSRLTGAQVYRERVPHYPLPDADGAIYHSFQWGRVLFIVTDDRFHRDPKTNPDGPEHHMLGPAQLDWIEATLRGARANGAEAVVLTTGVQWHVGGAGSDSWGGYAHERDKLTAIVEDTGWADHLIMLQADAHSLAMDDGASNPYGGWPLYLLASIDATPSNVSTIYYNIGVSNARGQYGILDVDDDGQRIVVTVSGYQGDTVLMEHSVILAESPAPPPPPPPAPNTPGAGDAEAVPTISWYAYDLLSLRRLAKLRGVSGSLSRALGASESSTLAVPTPLSGPMANRLVTSQVTAPNTLIVAEINKLPAWVGIVWKTEESSEGGYSLGCSTVESYLDRRYTRTMHFEQVEQVEIMRALAAKAADAVGIPLEFDIKATGIRRDRHYYDDEDATLYQRIQELSEVVNGPEWCIRAEYADEFGSQLRLIFTCRAEIGAGKDNAKGPISTKGRAKATWRLVHDWSKGNGANSVIATSSQAEGEERPQSVELMDIRGDHPKVEHRFSPSSSITEVTTLNDHADAELTAISRGTESIDIAARWDQAPVRLGLDIDIGDWLEYRLHGPTRPTGLVGVKRMIAWKLDTNNGTFSPTLLED